MELLEQIQKTDAKAFTHSGKFHADDVFSSALLLYLNPEIRIERGNRLPEDYDGLVFDIGRGTYDHHQKDSRVRENGVPYAAFGLLWEVLGPHILGEELAQRFDEEVVQPLDNNDNTGEKNELATLIGNFNPVWDARKQEKADGSKQNQSNWHRKLTDEEKSHGLTEEFLRAVQAAFMILENKFARYQADARAEQVVEEVLQQHLQAGGNPKILVLPEFVPCQKKLKDTDIAFVIFPSNRGGYCIQPQKKKGAMNYKCSFPEHWLGLENEELMEATGLASAGFCHKSGFLMTAGDKQDAIRACEISLAEYKDKPLLVCLWETKKNSQTENGDVSGQEQKVETMLWQLLGMQQAQICHMELPEIPELDQQGIYAEVALEKQEWRAYIKEFVKKILAYKPEAVYVQADLFGAYPVMHALRKKHVPVLTCVQKDGKNMIVRIPSGS